MHKLLLLLTLTSYCFSATVDAEGYFFGKSRHNNREAGYNETNPGLGIGLAYHAEESDEYNSDLTFAAGEYLDSYYKHARFVLVGMRGFIGERGGIHGTAGMSIGYFHGSGFENIGALPVISLGYDRIDLCLTGIPTGGDGVVAGFLKLRLGSF